MILRKSFYIRWSAGRSPRVHEVNPGRDPSQLVSQGRHGCISVGATTEFVECARGIPCLYTPEVHPGSDSWWIGESLWLMRMRPSRKDQYVSWTVGNRFYAIRL